MSDMQLTIDGRAEPIRAPALDDPRVAEPLFAWTEPSVPGTIPLPIATPETRP